MGKPVKIVYILYNILSLYSGILHKCNITDIRWWNDNKERKGETYKNDEKGDICVQSTTQGYRDKYKVRMIS